MKVSLSIVIANYNYGRYLKDAINSILSQCLPPVCVNGRNVLPVRGTDNAVELIICDAASTDDSVEIIQSYERYITWWCSEKDGGQSEAFNKGFCHSTGEWLTWLNADELLCPNVLYKFIQLVRQKKYSLFYFLVSGIVVRLNMCFTCLLGIYLFFILYIVSASLSVFQLMWSILNNACQGCS